MSNTLIPSANYDPFIFIWVLSGICGAVFLFGPLLVPRGPHQTWVTVYSSQIYPVTGPTFKKSTLMWISYSWGNGKGIVPVTLPTTTKLLRNRRQPWKVRTPPPNLGMVYEEDNALSVKTVGRLKDICPKFTFIADHNKPYPKVTIIGERTALSGGNCKVTFHFKNYESGNRMTFDKQLSKSYDCRLGHPSETLQVKWDNSGLWNVWAFGENKNWQSGLNKPKYVALEGDCYMEFETRCADKWKQYLDKLIIKEF